MTDHEAARIAMVDCQVRPADVTLYPVIAAMLAVPRERFVPAALREVAHAGTHLPLGPGRVLLDPRTFAKMLDALQPRPDMLVLDVAPGLGYSSAVLARMVAAVIALEEDPALAAQAAQILAETGADTVIVEQGPHAAGAPAHGPFDAILVNGAVETFPEALAAQLKPGGRAVAIFAEGALGKCRLGIRTAAGLTWRNVFDAAAPVLSGFERQRAFAL